MGSETVQRKSISTLILGAAVRLRQFRRQRRAWSDSDAYAQAFSGTCSARRLGAVLRHAALIALRNVSLSAAFRSTFVAPRRPPGALHGYKHARIILREVVLLLRRQLHHPARLVGVSERGEDFSADTKVGMVHVGEFFGFGQR